MRKFFIYIFFLTCTFIGCKEGPHNIVEEKLPIKYLKDDFQSFRRILEAVHPGIYLYNSEKEMNHRFDSVYGTLNADATVLDFVNRLEPIINSLHCGHTSLFLPENFSDSVHKLKAFFPIPVNVVEDKLVVNSTEFEIPLGAEIVSINNEKTSKLLPAMWQYEPVDGYNTLYQQEEGAWDFASNYFKFLGPQTSFKIGYRTEDSNNTIFLNMPAVTYSKVMDTERFFALSEDVNYDMEMFDEEGYALLTIYTFGYDTWSTDRAFENFIKNSFRLIQQSPNIHNLVIDLRNNTGGNFHNMFHLFGYLTKRTEWKEFKTAFTVFNRIPFTPYLSKGENDVAGIQASLDSTFSAKRQGRYVRQYADNETLYPSQYPFKGSVYVLTNSNVQSAAAYFAALLKDEGRAKIIGNETGGSGTNTNSFHLLTYELPNTKIRLTVPVVHAEFSLEQNNNTAGRGVQPDYPVSLSLTDLKENNDAQLGYVLDSLIKK